VHPTGGNDVLVAGTVDTLLAGHRLCQGGERIPAGTATVELSALRRGAPRPALDAELTSPRGTRIGGGTAVWRSGSATVALRPPVARERPIRICLRLRAGGAGARALLLGAPAERAGSATDDGQPLGGRFRVDYLPPRAQSWWAFAPTVVARIGRGHPWSGSSVTLAAALLALLSIGLASWLLVRTG